MNPKPTDFRCLHRLRVRWAEVDMQKIVFNAHYLMYFDTAMADYWRALAVPYEAALHQLGGDLYVKKASVEYAASAHYDDQIDVGLRCGRIGNSSITFEGAIFRGDMLLVTGELIYVYADPATQSSRPVPDPLRNLFMAYEDGHPMVTVQLADWGAVQSVSGSLRQRVLVEGQGMAPDTVRDAADASAVHALLTNRLGTAVASGRLVQQSAGVGHIGCLAVERVLRGSGLGRKVLQALIEAARQRGDHTVMLHAQRGTEQFYQRQGFRAQGDAFAEAGVASITMAKGL